MPPETDAQRWLRFAREDLDAARSLTESDAERALLLATGIVRWASGLLAP